MLLDGVHVVSDALTSDCTVRHILVAAESADRSDIAPILQRAAAQGIQVDEASAMVMEAASPVRSASVIVALADRPEAAHHLFTTPAAMIAIACDVQDPGNLGAIARVAEAAGASGLVVAGTGADPFGWKAVRGSMGSMLRLPIVLSDTADSAVDEAQRQGCRIVAAVPRKGQPLYGVNFEGALAVLIGAEGAGLPESLVERADAKVTIPMKPPVESLNTAVTAALILYEARRQRG
jgi:TrmH family RNA methyltransferase